MSDSGESPMGAMSRIGSNNGTSFLSGNIGSGLDSAKKNPKMQPIAPFAGTVGKMLEGMQGMAGQMGIANVSLANAFAPPPIVNMDKKIPSLFGGKGK